jgi:predicted acetyltransferase
MPIVIKQKSFIPERKLYEYDVENEAGDIVGFAQLRLNASKAADMPEGFESNVYYEITEKYRNKGYATKTLMQILTKAHNHGLDELIATVNDDNIASIKVIEKCGGQLEGKDQTLKGNSVLKYKLKYSSELVLN